MLVCLKEKKEIRIDTDDKKFWSLESLFAKLMEQFSKDVFVKLIFFGKIPFLCCYVEFLALGFNGCIDIL